MPHRVPVLRPLQSERESVVNLRLHFQKLTRRLAHLKPRREARKRVFKKCFRNVLDGNEPRCDNGQTLSLTVRIWLVEPVNTIGRKSGFCERLDDGLASMPCLYCVQ